MIKTKLAFLEDRLLSS